MTTAVLVASIAAKPAPARLKARIAGVLYLCCTIGGVYDMVVRESLTVHADAAATAERIMAAEALYRSALFGQFVGGACYIAVTVLLYELLKPAGRTLSLMAALFSLAGCVTGAASLVFLLAPPILLTATPYLAAFRPEQLQSLAYVALRLDDQGYNVSMIFFGIYCSLIGWLIFRSSFFPKILGLLVMLAGVGWLVDSLATLLWPPFDSLLNPWIQAPGFVGETSLCLWLLVVGINAPRWEDAARRAY